MAGGWDWLAMPLPNPNCGFPVLHRGLVPADDPAHPVVVIDEVLAADPVALLETVSVNLFNRWLVERIRLLCFSFFKQYTSL